jgi:hypothetical protein
MARQKGNSVMHNTRGIFNKQVVFKERAGRVYVAGPPNTKENRKPTAAQQLVQDRFKAASAYAKAVMGDAELKAAYANVANKRQTAYNIAFKDAYNAPKVTAIFANGYRGGVGDSIIIQAKDDFKVNEVKVSIFNANHELIEEGKASEMSGVKRSWNYTVTQANSTLSGTKLKATAYDIPENEGSLEVTL